ncbi:hypothetical protein OAF54_01070 [bacterium]|nr:hypothetical protein [bacterium]
MQIKLDRTKGKYIFDEWQKWERANAMPHCPRCGGVNTTWYRADHKERVDVGCTGSSCTAKHTVFKPWPMVCTACRNSWAVTEKPASNMPPNSQGFDSVEGWIMQTVSRAVEELEGDLANQIVDRILRGGDV